MTPRVTISAAGPLVRIEPALPLLGNLRVGRLEAVDASGSRFGTVPVALFVPYTTVGGGIGAEMWRGLAAVVKGMHKDTGIPSVTGQGRPRRTVVPLKVEVNTDESVVAFVEANESGVVRYEETVVDVLWLIVQICLAYAVAKIVVIVRKKNDFNILTNLLKRHGISPAATGYGMIVEDGKRVVVALLGQLGGVDLHKFDIVLIADAMHATWGDPLIAPPLPDPNGPGVATGRAVTGLMERLVSAGSARVFGFLPLDRHRSPFDLARSWQIYGSNEITIPRPGIVTRPVAAAIMTGTMISSAKDTVAAVRNRVRMCHPRNRRLARLARALRDGDRATASRLLPLAEYNGPRHVLLLADDLKQASALGRYLPIWPVVSGLGDDPRDLPDDTANQTRGVIATALGVEALAGSEYNVVVRADPGDGLPPFPPKWLEAFNTQATPLLLIDVRDAGHPLAALWARMRRRAYRAAGWAVLGEDPEVTAWRRFRHLVLERGACR